MGDHGDSQALPTVLCAPEAAAPWVPVTSPIPGLTPLPVGEPVPTFPLPTDVPTLATHPFHGETDPEGPMGGTGASEPVDEAEALQALPYAPAAALSPAIVTTQEWASMSRSQKRHYRHRNQ